MLTTMSNTTSKRAASGGSSSGKGRKKKKGAGDEDEGVLTHPRRTPHNPQEMVSAKKDEEGKKYYPEIFIGLTAQQEHGSIGAAVCGTVYNIRGYLCPREPPAALHVHIPPTPPPSHDLR